MTLNEWIDGLMYLKNSDFDASIEHEGRTVIIVNMCGGRYLCLDNENEIVGLTSNIITAMKYLDTGEFK